MNFHFMLKEKIKHLAKQYAPDFIAIRHHLHVHPELSYQEFQTSEYIREQLKKIETLVAAGVKEGAELYQPPCRLPSKGFYFKPTLFSGVAMSHRIAREEIFGPVLSILTFRTVEEAVEKANNTAYGLSAGVWTDKGSRILKMSTELKAGVVWANTYNKFDPTSPFGGYKESGFGREGGRQGLLDYVKCL